MPAPYRTPGVYVEEISTLPPSVAEVSTAVPAFLGYTEAGKPFVPTRIQHLRDYEEAFGGPPQAISTVAVTGDGVGVPYTVQPTVLKADKLPLLYYSLRLYFENGGGPCYIVSIGGHSETVGIEPFKTGLKALLKEDEPTLIVMPDATRLDDANHLIAVGAALDHCGTMRDRFAVLDLKAAQTAAGFRQVSSDYLSYGAAYTPFLETALPFAFDEAQVTITSASTSSNFSGTVGGLTITCNAAADKSPKAEVTAGSDDETVTFVADASPKLSITAGTKATTKKVAAAWAAWKTTTTNTPNGFDILPGDETLVKAGSTTLVAPRSLSAFKGSNTTLYNQVKATLGTLRATLPPSGAVAGIYARVDRDRGVWKAPANVAVASVLKLAQTYSNSDLDGLNIDPTGGKSINAIRSFTGRGTLVWGARTLAGNDNEWRYVSVRRLFIMIEESSLKATAFAVFEPNTAETWLKVKAMIESFLYGLWERGALAGAKPEDAYFVNVGIGTTMTAQNVLDGYMIVKIGVAAVRPAEFIILQFSHRMQQS